jgi:hypothetical protein
MGSWLLDYNSLATELETLGFKAAASPRGAGDTAETIKITKIWELIVSGWSLVMRNWLLAYILL